MSTIAILCGVAALFLVVASPLSLAIYLEQHGVHTNPYVDRMTCDMECCRGKTWRDREAPTAPAGAGLMLLAVLCGLVGAVAFFIGFLYFCR